MNNHNRRDLLREDALHPPFALEDTDNSAVS